jgi:hypothetical protein
MVNLYTLGFQNLLMATTTTGVATGQAATFVNHSLPWQVRVTEVGYTTDNPGCPGVTA